MRTRRSSWRYGRPTVTADFRAVGRCRKALPRLRPVPFSLSSKEFSRGTLTLCRLALKATATGQRTRAQQRERRLTADLALRIVSRVFCCRCECNNSISREVDTRKDCARVFWVWRQTASGDGRYPAELALAWAGFSACTKREKREEGRSSAAHPPRLHQPTKTRRKQGAHDNG